MSLNSKNKTLLCFNQTKLLSAKHTFVKNAYAIEPIYNFPAVSAARWDGTGEPWQIDHSVPSAGACCTGVDSPKALVGVVELPGCLLYESLGNTPFHRGLPASPSPRSSPTRATRSSWHTMSTARTPASPGSTSLSRWVRCVAPPYYSPGATLLTWPAHLPCLPQPGSFCPKAKLGC